MMMCVVMASSACAAPATTPIFCSVEAAGPQQKGRPARRVAMFELHAAKGTSCTQRDAPDGTLREAILCRSRDAPDGTLAAFVSHTCRSLPIRPAQMAGPRQVGPTRLAVERAETPESRRVWNNTGSGSQKAWAEGVRRLRVKTENGQI